ncbi:MAG: TIGR02921 family PEP-CTERM protein [Leptolyngbyaceae cyanobacterium SM1_3_5]|nr:TIGR02921 family PEP-CTERM protein [Leptolyngbyaceae cyanobacterium SM1_3_5]
MIRRGLLNAYLAAYRYPYIEDQWMQLMYESEFGLSPETTAAIQQAYDFVMSPFTYRGTRSDIDKAAGLYGQFFDTPILRGESQAIKRAIQSTFDRNQAKAGLLDVDERRVWLADQQVTVTPHGDWADVEIYETYDNQTIEQQEILYFFSLPESAVITGIWLGESSDRRRAFPYTIAPRGAAQQVYNEEVERRIDPALLEQTGPRQYRLRAFPIPPIGQGEMHLWFTYKVLQQAGNWPLPQLAERRNLYWTRQTQRQINGKSASSKDWLPASIAAPKTPRSIAKSICLGALTSSPRRLTTLACRRGSGLQSSSTAPTA